jgi:hypothetical protein
VIAGPNDPRALRRTPRGVIDSNGVEHEAFVGSIADITNGRLDAYFERPGGLVDRLTALLTEEVES